MFRVASLLIVMAFAASPTAKVVCDLACLAESTSSNAARVSCHGAEHGLGPALKAIPEACARVAALGPFMARDAYTGVSTGSGPFVAVAIHASVRDLRRGDGVVPVRVNAGPPPASSITVLRI